MPSEGISRVFTRTACRSPRTPLRRGPLQKGPRYERKPLLALDRAGFFVHHIPAPTHPETPFLPVPRVAVAMHNQDLKRKTLPKILDQAGLSQEEFLKFL
jgi:hypothetical protein